MRRMDLTEKDIIDNKVRFVQNKSEYEQNTLRSF